MAHALHSPLTHQDLLDLVSAAVSVQLTDSRAVLLTGVPPTIVAGIPLAATPAAQILSDLAALNAVDTLPDGTVPLSAWLYNAIALSSPRKDAARFAHALQRLHSIRSLSETTGRALIPAYPDAATRALSAQLAEAQQRKSRLEATGADTKDALAEILRLKRQIRDGGQLKAGDYLGDGTYLLLELLGRGGFASVWRACDTRNGNIVAVKVLHSTLAGDRLRLDRFKRGARIMGELRHKSIVRVLEPYGEDGGWHYFVMELLQGGTLQQAIIERRLPRDRILAVLIEVCGAVALAHSRSIVHRDLKPANILLDSNSAPKVTDFDLAGAPDTTGGTRTGALGTVLYTAPELLDSAEGADPRADVYSLGMTAIFCLSEGALSTRALGRAHTVVEGLPTSFSVKSVLLRATRWDNKYARFADAEQLRIALIDAAARQQTNRTSKIADKATKTRPDRVASTDQSSAMVESNIGRLRTLFRHLPRNTHTLRYWLPRVGGTIAILTVCVALISYIMDLGDSFFLLPSGTGRIVVFCVLVFCLVALVRYVRKRFPS